MEGKNSLKIHCTYFILRMEEQEEEVSVKLAFYFHHSWKSQESQFAFEKVTIQFYLEVIMAEVYLKLACFQG